MNSVQNNMNERKIRQNNHRKNPPTYTGMRRGRMARDWALEIERILLELSFPYSQLRVELAIENFTRDALIWWKIVSKYHQIKRFHWRDSSSCSTGTAALG